MNSNLVGRIVFLVLALGLALWVGATVLTGGGNVIGQLGKFGMLGLGAFAILNPKGGFYVLIGLTAYLDAFKRLLVLGDYVSGLDLYYTLGMAPAVMLGICIGVTAGLFRGSFSSRASYWWLYGISILGFTILGGAALLSSGGGESQEGIAGVVNAGAYIPMLFVVPILFPSPEAQLKLLRITVLTYIPVALYTCWQAAFGLSDLEYAYLLTGLSIESRILWEQEVLRPFSTMNAAQTVSIVMSVFAVMAWGISGKLGGLKHSHRVTGFLIVALFVIAAWFTVSRTGWLCGVVAAGAAVMFRTRLTTVLAYSSGVAVAVTLILASDYLLESRAMANLESSMTDETVGDARSERTATMGTLNARFESFSFLKNNKEIWTPFGIAAAGRQDPREYFRIHDAITDYLVRIGYVPLFSLLIVGGAGLTYMHHRILSIAPVPARRIAIVAMACAMGIASGALASPAQLRVYPVNVFFYAFMGVAAAMIVHHPRRGGTSVGRSPVSTVPSQREGAGGRVGAPV